MFFENILTEEEQVEALINTFFSEQNLKNFKIDIVEIKTLGAYAHYIFQIELSYLEKPTSVIKKYKFINKN
jgi:hypothetical protein